MNPMIPSECCQCGAPAREGLTCRQQYEALLALEYQDPKGAGALHHLTVLCYILQHPNDFSSEALAWASRAVEDTLEHGMSTEEFRRRAREIYAPEARRWKVTRALRPTGSLSEPVSWALTVADVYTGAPDGHIQRVRAWAVATLETVRRRRAQAAAGG